MVYPHLELDLASAKAMPFFHLCDTAWSAVADTGYKSNFGFDVETYVYHLPAPWRIAYTVHEMEYCVLGGGFTSYFDTHTQTLHQDALNGFKLIGAKKHHVIVQQALKLQQDEEALRELDSLYYDCCAEEDPRELLASYILEHFSAYREPKQSRLALWWRALKLPIPPSDKAALTVGSERNLRSKMPPKVPDMNGIAGHPSPPPFPHAEGWGQPSLPARAGRSRAQGG